MGDFVNLKLQPIFHLEIRPRFQIRCSLFLPFNRYGKCEDEINFFVAWNRTTIPRVFRSYLTNDTYSMKPYTKEKLTNKRRIFYYILSLSQKTVDWSFGILKYIFRIYIGTNMLRNTNCEFDLQNVCCPPQFA